MNSKLKGAGAVAALLGLGAMKACSKVALVAGHAGGETAALGLSHTAPTAIHAMEFGAGDTAAIARSALHQTDALSATGATAHTFGDAAASSGDDASHGMSSGVTHDTEHEHGFMHEVGHKLVEEGFKQATEPKRDNRDDPRGFENFDRYRTRVIDPTEGSR